jgi:hypothetical protein
LQEAARAKKLGAPAQALGELGLHRLGGNIQLHRNFFVRESIQITKHDDLPAPIRQSPHGLGQELKFLIAADALSHIGPVYQDGRFVDMGYVVQCDAASTTKKIQCGIPRRREKKRLGVMDGSRRVRPEETGIRVLHDVVLIFKRGKTPVEVGSQCGLKRLHLLGEPPGLIERVRGLGRRQTHGNRSNATLPQTPFGGTRLIIPKNSVEPRAATQPK